MIYPAVVAVMAVVVVVVLATFVMPKFVIFFKSFNAQLPLPTRMLLSVSNFVSTWWFAILGVIVLAVVGIIALRRSRSGKAWLDSMVLKLPVVGDLVRTAVIERICRILSSMIRAGVALPDAMRVTAESSNNAVYREGLDHSPRGDDGGPGARRAAGPHGSLPWGGPPDVPRRRGDGHARRSSSPRPRPSTTGSST